MPDTQDDQLAQAGVEGRLREDRRAELPEPADEGRGVRQHPENVERRQLSRERSQLLGSIGQVRVWDTRHGALLGNRPSQGKVRRFDSRDRGWFEAPCLAPSRGPRRYGKPTSTPSASSATPP